MNYDALLYESALLILALAACVMAFVLVKLTQVAGKKQGLWILPVLAGLAVLAAAGAHVYASYHVLPELSKVMDKMSTSEVLLDAAKSSELKAAVETVKKQLMDIKVMSFSMFLAASVLLFLSTSIYLRWISK